MRIWNTKAISGASASLTSRIESMFSRFQGAFTKILSRVLDRNFNCRRPGIIIVVDHKSINLNSPNHPLIYKYDVQFFFFAFSEPFSWLTNASKPFTDQCFLKKSYFQADDPGFFAEILDFLSLIR